MNSKINDPLIKELKVSLTTADNMWALVFWVDANMLRV